MTDTTTSTYDLGYELGTILSQLDRLDQQHRKSLHNSKQAGTWRFATYCKCGWRSDHVSRSGMAAAAHDAHVDDVAAELTARRDELLAILVERANGTFDADGISEILRDRNNLQAAVR